MAQHRVHTHTTHVDTHNFTHTYIDTHKHAVDHIFSFNQTEYIQTNRRANTHTCTHTHTTKDTLSALAPFNRFSLRVPFKELRKLQATRRGEGELYLGIFQVSI